MRAHRPDLMPRYEELYRDRSYVPAAEKKRIAAMVDAVRPPRRKRPPARRPRPERGRAAAAKQEPQTESAQPTLF
jgi:hypothetical protein